jgi:hypothetical protein
MSSNAVWDRGFVSHSLDGCCLLPQEEELERSSGPSPVYLVLSTVCKVHNCGSLVRMSEPGQLTLQTDGLHATGKTTGVRLWV